jgi:hypothetical protein
MTATATVSATYIVTRHARSLQLRVNGTPVPLGADRFTTSDRAASDARRLIDTQARHMGLSVLTIDEDYSPSLRSRWTLRATLGPAQGGA